MGNGTDSGNRYYRKHAHPEVARTTRLLRELPQRERQQREWERLASRLRRSAAPVRHSARWAR